MPGILTPAATNSISLMTTHYSVYLGTIGWEHPDWNGSFYPEDLPEDWRLAYYATQFRSVFVPAEYWARASDRELAVWVEETRPEFRFVLEEGEPGFGKAREITAVLGERLAGFFKREAPPLVWFDGGTDLKALKAGIEAAGQGEYPLFLMSRDADVVVMERVRTLLDLMGL